MADYKDGLLFSDELQKEIKSRFLYVDSDPAAGRRLFFENAGGALRLKSVNSAYAAADAFPDCSSRKHKRAKDLDKMLNDGFADMRILFNADPVDGAIIGETASSQVMFTIVGTILEAVPGTNVVTTELEHPSVFDSIAYFAKKTGKEVRVAKGDPKTGGVAVDDIVKLIDKDTAMLNVIWASNITGAILDIQNIVEKARAIKPDLYIVSDAVQHIPHGVVDVKKIPLDAVNFAAYKVFGCRGFGVGYLSRRAAALPHPNIAGNTGNIWEIGGGAPAMYAALSEIVNYVCWLGSQFSKSPDKRALFEEGMTRIKLQERALMARTLDGTDTLPGLRKIKNIKVQFDNPNLVKRDFIMALTFDNIGYTEAVAEYAKRGVIVYDRNETNYYSVRTLHAFGLKGIVRVSPLHCHSAADVDTFLKASAEIAKL